MLMLKTLSTPLRQSLKDILQYTTNLMRCALIGIFLYVFGWWVGLSIEAFHWSHFGGVS